MRDVYPEEKTDPSNGDYAVGDEILGHEGEPSTDGSSLTIINILDVVRRVKAWPPAVLG